MTRPFDSGSAELDAAVELVYFEARLLDDRRFEEWLALFAEEAWYWMPASHDQVDPDSALSLLYEDRRLLALRVRRLSNPALLVESPPPRSHRHLSSVRARRGADMQIEVTSSQWIVVLKDGEQQFMSARCEYRLRRTGPSLLIVSKTVRLLDCDAPRRGFAAPL